MLAFVDGIHFKNSRISPHPNNITLKISTYKVT